MTLLGSLYPEVNWNRVDFFEGLPWFTPAVAPYVTAQALPDFYSFSKFRIYLLKFDESRAQCLSDMVHEAFHVMQATQFTRGYGLGFFRGFLVYYIADFFKYGYRQNPFEVPAYDQEFRFLQYCLRKGMHGIEPQTDPRLLLQGDPDQTLVHRTFAYRYQGKFPALAASVILCLLITVTRPVADLLVWATKSLTREKKKKRSRRPLSE